MEDNDLNFEVYHINESNNFENTNPINRVEGHFEKTQNLKVQNSNQKINNNTKSKNDNITHSVSNKLDMSETSAKVNQRYKARTSQNDIVNVDDIIIVENNNLNYKYNYDYNNISNRDASNI